jgi:2-oxopent-4-enoate/cis-2-oxohex-4-enoate hydratase
MEDKLVNMLADDLFHASLNRSMISPLTDRYPDITIEEAYQISLAFLRHRQAAGEKIVGKKIGVTSAAVMDMLNVRQPDFGFLTDAMRHDAEMDISSSLIQPKAEGEIAFLMKKNIIGPGVTNNDILAATEMVMPCFEVVDSRIKDWKIKIQDTIADNASCGFFAVNEAAAVNPKKIDLISCSMEVYKNGLLVSEGSGSAAMGNPITCVAWLANTLGEKGIPLNAGDIVLSGSLVPFESVVAGDRMTVKISGMGECCLAFS